MTAATTLTAILLAGALAAPAHADRWPVEQVETAIATADQHWPNSPCIGHHDITWDTWRHIQSDLKITWPDYIVQPGMIGFGSYLGCQVWIAWDAIDAVDRYGTIGALCTLLTHEFGHNAGLQHSDDPRNVMFPGIVRTSDNCRAAFPAPPVRHHHTPLRPTPDPAPTHHRRPR